MYIYAIRILVEVINASSLQEQTQYESREREESNSRSSYIKSHCSVSPCISLSFSLYLPLLHNIIFRQVAFLLYLMLSLGRWYLFTLDVHPFWRHFSSQQSRQKNQPRYRRGWFNHPRVRCHQIGFVLGSKYPSLAFLSFRSSSLRSPKRVPLGNSTMVCFSLQSLTTHVDNTLTTHNISIQLIKSFLVEVTR